MTRLQRVNSVAGIVSAFFVAAGVVGGAVYYVSAQEHEVEEITEEVRDVRENVHLLEQRVERLEKGQTAILEGQAELLKEFRNHASTD